MGLAFQSRWEGFFQGHPDKAVAILALHAGCVNIILLRWHVNTHHNQILARAFTWQLHVC
jgi:hypothetical protein